MYLSPGDTRSLCRQRLKVSGSSSTKPLRVLIQEAACMPRHSTSTLPNQPLHKIMLDQISIKILYIYKRSTTFAEACRRRNCRNHQVVEDNATKPALRRDACIQQSWRKGDRCSGPSASLICTRCQENGRICTWDRVIAPHERLTSTSKTKIYSQASIL